LALDLGIKPLGKRRIDLVGHVSVPGEADCLRHAAFPLFFR
jgi:hypothetical protein